MRFTKKLLAIMLVFVLALASIPVIASANDTITVTIDGVAVEFDDQGPVIVGNVTLVPARFVFEDLGFTPTWDSAARTATLTRTDYVVVVTIGSATFTVNGESHSLEVPAQLIGGRTMIPLRAVLENVGYEVDWDSATRTVVITTEIAEEPTPPIENEPEDEQEGEPEVEVELEDEESDFLSHFDLNAVQELLQQHAVTEIPDGHMVFDLQYGLMDEFYFDFGDGRVTRWQFIWTDGLAFWELATTEVADVLGSYTGMVFLLLNQDGDTFLYIDLGSFFERYGEEGHPEWGIPDWMTEYHRAYHVIPLD